ncbi:MAG: serine/threonine protein kinase [Clostridia bacterium]|nr:serine/threonine protein kinase [Clostridia bacterium]
MDFSFGNTLSKGSVYESDSILGAWQHDARSHLADGARPEAISNEEIHKGDEILETYRVEDDAIHGGMGSVWRVHHKSWNVDLAMKRPQPRFFSEGSEQRKAEFVAECEHWINLGLHPNIVSCYYVRDISGVPTIFSEWMEGGSLKDAIRSGRLYEGTEEEIQARILDIAIQTARGLAYSHEQGLIHQDVKPGNLLLTGDWEAKVADFGLAKAQSRLAGGDKPLSSGYTLAYCPREQADGAPAEAWMDAYAWALTVLEMYLGGHPWETGAEAKGGCESYCAQSRVAIPRDIQALIANCLCGRTNGFEAVLPALRSGYLEATGLYYKDEERLGYVSAANLNNHAISMLDLGNRAQAEKLWNRALELQPDNMNARLNRVFFRWKEGTLSYTQALQSIEDLNESEPRTMAVEELVREESGLEEAVVYDCRNPLDACVDGDGFLWILSGGELLRYDMQRPERLHAVSAEYRYCFDALCSSRDGRYLYAAIGSGYYSGLDYSIVRLDTKDGFKLEDVHAHWKEGAGYEDFRAKYVKAVPYGSRCASMWLEEDDGRLCVLEKSIWRDQGDDTFHTTTFLEYRLGACDCGELLNGPQFVKDGGEEAEGIHARWRRGTHRDGWQDKHFANRVVADFGDYVLLNGQIKMLEREPAQRRTAVSGSPSSAAEDYAATLCRKVSAAGPHYRLSRFVSVKRAVALNEEQERVEGAFWDAMQNGNYADAIAQFEHYRELPERQDCEQSIQMERRLSTACRRARVHHSITSDEWPGRMAKPVFQPIFAQNRTVMTSKTLRRYYPEEIADIYAPLKKAYRKLPYRCVKDGTEALIGTGKAYIKPVLLNDDHSICFIWCEKEGALKVHLDSGEIEPAAVVDSSYPNIASFRSTDDGRLFAVRLKEGWQAFTGEHIRGEGFITGECWDLCFSPDSRFALWRSYSDERFYITELGNGFRQVPTVMMSPGDSHAVSEDGFQIAMFNREGRVESGCRLSYEYEYTGMDGATEKSDDTSMEKRADSHIPKGLLSLIFGKRGRR